MTDDKRQAKKPVETDGVRRPATKPVLKNPKQAGDPDSPALPDFGQSVEAGGVD